eukprot:31928-Chlamydomonas_euryale.AAC.1
MEPVQKVGRGREGVGWRGNFETKALEGGGEEGGSFRDACALRMECQWEENEWNSWCGVWGCAGGRARLEGGPRAERSVH